ncbi:MULTISPECIES: DUF2334 domain-containing protein [unclassified Clostridium]|uniref:DUF2334 domain-containing protein n=1 Tax=unclassified Clostridium TaxID=2614128 RepID=UPI0002976DF7|nr:MULTISPECIES: DUF2334 domain-containing protein [unclassified Clostridium]EKQ53561.1 MAG: hypothetical protein A370_03606 [Clostridium sp. Maddingley MBC34-26]
MLRNKKILICSFLGLILSLSLIYQILSYFNFFRKNITIINKTLYSNLLPEDNFKSIYTPKIKFADRAVTKISGIRLDILNETNITNVPMLLKAQRYYVPLSFICAKLNYTLDTSNNSISISNNSNTISLTETSYEKNSKTGSLRGNLISSSGNYYISISDIEELFDLIAVFDFQNKKISLLPNDVKAPEESSILYSDKVALIRFEDFGCGYSNIVDKNQTKVKIMTNLLYSNGMKFHVSWIPRFVVPSANFDNDLLTNDNITNVGFVNLLDYILNKGGEIGLHGYTHQSGNDASGNGEEMSKDVNSTEAETRAVIEKGIDTASALNLPMSYYESPHYRDTVDQKKIISEYFQFVYEPYDYSKSKNIYKPDNSHLFVPTPLSRISDPSKDTETIINKLNDNDPDILNSFYYHPSIEINYINFNIDGNKLNVTYDVTSPLQQIVKALKDDDYTTLHIDELIDK